MSMTPPDRWRELARNNENAASILRGSGATAEVIAVFMAAAKEATGVAEALDEHAAKCGKHKEQQ